MLKEDLKTVNEVSKLTGISVRTLHYYDEIGLLLPAELTESGYRLYDKGNLLKLEQILFLKEMGFELKQIKVILEDPHYDMQKALRKQREILRLKSERLHAIMTLIDEKLEGDEYMNFKAFDMKEIERAQEKFKEEVEERWGQTDAYKENARRTSGYKKEDWQNIMASMNDIFKALACHMGEDVSCKEVQDLIEAWRAHITKYFYECTPEILSGLGDMYVMDERFTNNINQYGEGLAQFMDDAIKYYCLNRL